MGGPQYQPDCKRVSADQRILQYYDALMKWRAGGGLDPVADLGPLNPQTTEPFKLRLAMDYYLQHQDKEALQKLLTGFFKGPVSDQ